LEDKKMEEEKYEWPSIGHEGDALAVLGGLECVAAECCGEAARESMLGGLAALRDAINRGVI
jgi:hypothetical protein